MADSITIEIPDLPDFRADMMAAPRIVGEEVTVAIRKTALHGEALSKIYISPRIDTGGARGSIYSKTQASAGGAIGIWGASAEHAIVIEKGRRAGAKMPPKGALLGWHGVTEENEFVIRRAIGRRGIKAHPFVGKAFKEITNGFVQRELSAAIKRALARIGGG